MHNRKFFKLGIFCLLFLYLMPVINNAALESDRFNYKDKIFKICPEHYKTRPALPSPYTSGDGGTFIISSTRDKCYTIIPVTLKTGKPGQDYVDGDDFPTLALRGLHSDLELDMTYTITGRSIAEITDLGRPGGLSNSGFMGEKEDIISVLKGDNNLVSSMGLTHPKMAVPVFYTYNLVITGEKLGNFTKRNHDVTEYPFFLYNGKKVFMKALFTKGGQESIFDDGITGAVAIDIWRDLTPQERTLIEAKYGQLGEEKLNLLIKKLSHLQTGEMEPYYAMAYGFYEGHTEWRIDPLAIAFIYGLKSLEELEAAFPGRLFDVLTGHFVRK